MRRPPSGPPALLLRPALVLLPASLLLAACAAGTAQAPSVPGSPATAATSAVPAGSASVAPGTVTAVPLCDPTADPASATAYPGWPVPGQAQTAAAIPIIASSEVAVGPNRLVFTFVDDQNALLASADVPVTARFFDLAADPATPVHEVQATFLDPGTGRGLYRASVDLPCAGAWGAEFSVGLPAGVTTPRTIFEVRPTSFTPAIGAPAPRSDSPTASTAGEAAAISTDRSPDPRLYAMTVGQAVTSGRPSVIAFATPAFCQTAMCGPVLDRVKAVAADYADRVAFVNVEPYVLHETVNGLQPLPGADGQPQPVPAVLEWGLRTEPYVFVVDAEGRVTAKLEGSLDEAELREALDAVL